MKTRNTVAQEEILKILKTSSRAFSHEAIQQKLHISIDRATIYRVLNRFHGKGLVHKITADDGKHYFALCSSCTETHHDHEHFHFRCTACGLVECLSNKISVLLPEGYAAKKFNAMISGVCNTCNQI